MTPELAYKLNEAGCQLLQFGVETGNPEIMKFIRKGITLEQVENVAEYSLAAGLDVLCSFIIGFPWDTHETVQQTIDLSQKLQRMGKPWKPKCGRLGVDMIHLTPLPGTYIYDHAKELGLRFLTHDWDKYTFTESVIETEHLSADDIRSFYIKARHGFISDPENSKDKFQA